MGRVIVAVVVVMLCLVAFTFYAAPRIVCSPGDSERVRIAKEIDRTRAEAKAAGRPVPDVETLKAAHRWADTHKLDKCGGRFPRRGRGATPGHG